MQCGEELCQGRVGPELLPPGRASVCAGELRHRRGQTWVRLWATGSANGVEDQANDSLPLSSLPPPPPFYPPLIFTPAAGALCLDWGPWVAAAPDWDCYLVLPPALDSYASFTASDGKGPRAVAGATVCPIPWTMRRLQSVDARVREQVITY